MQNSVAAIRAGHSGTRFLPPPSDRTHRRLGLPSIFVVPRRGTSPQVGRGQPLAELRRAARATRAATPSAAATLSALRRQPRLTWSRPAGTAGIRRIRARSAAPWRA